MQAGVRVGGRELQQATRERGGGTPSVCGYVGRRSSSEGGAGRASSGGRAPHTHADQSGQGRPAHVWDGDVRREVAAPRRLSLRRRLQSCLRKQAQRHKRGRPASTHVDAGCRGCHLQHARQHWQRRVRCGEVRQALRATPATASAQGGAVVAAPPIPDRRRLAPLPPEPPGALEGKAAVGRATRNKACLLRWRECRVCSEIALILASSSLLGSRRGARNQHAEPCFRRLSSLVPRLCSY